MECDGERTVSLDFLLFFFRFSFELSSLSITSSMMCVGAVGKQSILVAKKC